MITYFCSPDKSVRNLFELIYKLYKHGRKVLVITKNEEDMNVLDETFWKNHKFLPHGNESDPYLSDQPVVISTKKINIAHFSKIKFDTHIYFHNSANEYDSVENVLWNPESAEARGKIWREENGKWHLGSI